MRRKVRAVRPVGGEVAACNQHLHLAMEKVTSPPDGDTHVVVRRTSGEVCAFRFGGAIHTAQWLLIPQAVIV